MTVDTLLNTIGENANNRNKKIRVLSNDDKRKYLGNWFFNADKEVKGYQIKSEFILIYV